MRYPEVKPDSSIYNECRMWFHQQVGLRDEHNRLPMPSLTHLSSDHVHRNGTSTCVATAILNCALIRVHAFQWPGIHLINNTLGLYLWVGKEVESHYLSDLFGVSSFDQVPYGEVGWQYLVESSKQTYSLITSTPTSLPCLSWRIHSHSKYATSSRESDLSIRAS
jgi:hypothetical protein